MRYAEYPPSPRCVRLVERFWILEGQAGGVPDAIIPDGRIELIVHYSGTFWRHAGGTVTQQPTSLLVGQMTGPAVLAPEGYAGVAAIRLRSAAARTLLGFSLDEISERFVDLEAVFPSVARLRQQLADAREDAERIAAMERWLLERACPDPRVQIEVAVDTILRSGGRASVEYLSDLTGLGIRQIERQFQQDVGLSPKTFSRIVRLQAALARIRAGQPLADVALGCGFYDQAHMARDFRHLAAMSPTAWQSHAGDLAPLFISQP
jgi:AraC-like DNA-binding protein